MSDVQSVTIQLQRPSPTSAGQVTTGHYIVQDGKIIMTYEDGAPVIKEMGSRYEHEIRPGDDIVAVAGALTRTVRRELVGMTEEQEVFGRPIEYPVAGVA